MFIYLYYGFVFSTIGFVIFFQLLFVRTRRSVQLVCSIIWLLPVCYEMWALDRCGSDCSARVDLMLVFPSEVVILTGASVYAWLLHKHYMQRSN
jgi:hypothetical protein